MTAEALLARLEGVRKTGADRWIARAPTRADKHPSLSVRELSDGRVLLHDFGGDSVEDILAAVNLALADLYPPRALDHGAGRERRPFNAHDVLACLALEATIAADCSRQLRNGKTLSDVDHARLLTASARLAAGSEMVNA